MAEAATSMTWAGLLRGVGQWFKENLPWALVMAAASFGFAWLVNFVVMAFRWDGFRAPGGEGSDYIAAQGSLVTGSLFWAGLTSLLFALAAYGYRVGWDQLLQELVGLPQRIGAMFRGEERNRSLTTLMWALMLSLLLGLVVSPAVAGISAGFFVVFAATPLGSLLSGVLRRLWMQLIVRFAPHKGEPTNEVGAAAVAAAGMVAGFAIAAMIDSIVLRLLTLVVAALVAYYFANEDELAPGTGTAVLVLVAVGVGLHELLEAGIAFADDGGWSECGDCNVFDYVTSTGATEVVSRSTVAGGSAGVGAPVGAAVGDVLGTIGGGGGGSPAPAPTGGGAQPSAPASSSDGSDILGAIGGGEGGAVSGGGGGGEGGVVGTDGATSGDSAPTAGTDDGGAAARSTAEPDGSEPPPGDVTAATGRPVEAADEPGAGGAHGADGAGTSDDDAILGAIGGGEGGGTAGTEPPPPTGDAARGDAVAAQDPAAAEDDVTGRDLGRRRPSGEGGDLPEGEDPS